MLEILEYREVDTQVDLLVTFKRKNYLWFLEDVQYLLD